MSRIIDVLQNIAPLSDSDCTALNNLISTVTLNKGEYWISTEKNNRNIAFVEDGYLRKFYVKDGNEITDFFYFQNDFCADLPSIIGETKPLASIIAMKKTTLNVFSYDALNNLCEHSHSLEHLHRKIIEYTFLRFYKRTVSFILQTPLERYDELIKSHPNVFQNAAQYHIASYLGISPQHLSRLRGINR